MIDATEQASGAVQTPPVTDRYNVDAATAAEASSAHARINIPLNLENWRHLPEDTQRDLAWFHQHALQAHITREDLCDAVKYDWSTLFRVLKGTYEGSWPNVLTKIRSYKKLIELRASMTIARCAPNSVTKQISWVLDYALGGAKCVMLLGEPGLGKTIGTTHWSVENNHGRSVLIEALPIGGAKGMMRQIAEKVGVNKNLNAPQMLEAIVRAFNSTRILIVDEIQHHIPTSRACKPIALEVLRRIHDLSGCALAFIGTIRVEQDIKSTAYMYEQVLGRTGRPFYLPNELTAEDVAGIVKQFIPRPTADFVETMVSFANNRELGRLRYMTDTLTFASRIANQGKRRLTEEMVYASHALREQKAKAYLPKGRQ